LVTIVSNGTILYHYAGAYAPPLIAPVLSGTSTTTSITLKWTAASGGVPPYSYKVYDAVSGMLVRTTTGLTATLTGFAPETSHTYSIQTVDHAGRHIRSNYVTITTLDD
jgi:mannan endo-1,4-beta-mannosidase